MPYADPEVRRTHYRDRIRARRAEYRRLVFEHYGTKCAECGATSDLTLDHVNGDGAEHRAELGANGEGCHFYGYLVRNGFPDDYELQTLCRPCNTRKG